MTSPPGDANSTEATPPFNNATNTDSEFLPNETNTTLAGILVGNETGTLAPAVLPGTGIDTNNNGTDFGAVDAGTNTSAADTDTGLDTSLGNETGILAPAILPETGTDTNNTDALDATVDNATASDEGMDVDEDEAANFTTDNTDELEIPAAGTDTNNTDTLDAAADNATATASNEGVDVDEDEAVNFTTADTDELEISTATDTNNTDTDTDTLDAAADNATAGDEGTDVDADGDGDGAANFTTADIDELEIPAAGTGTNNTDTLDAADNATASNEGTNVDGDGDGAANFTTADTDELEIPADENDTTPLPPEETPGDNGTIPVPPEEAPADNGTSPVPPEEAPTDNSTITIDGNGTDTTTTNATANANANATAVRTGSLPTKKVSFACVLEVEFFPGQGQEPTRAEVATLLKETVSFFTDLLSQDPATQNDFVEFDISNPVPVYNDAQVDTFKLTMDAVAVVSKNGSVDADVLAEVMGQANYNNFISNYIWLSEPFMRNEFYQTHHVTVNGEAEDEQLGRREIRRQRRALMFSGTSKRRNKRQ
jgi:hypothetical protein